MNKLYRYFDNHQHQSTVIIVKQSAVVFISVCCKTASALTSVKVAADVDSVVADSLANSATPHLIVINFSRKMSKRSSKHVSTPATSHAEKLLLDELVVICEC